MLKFYILVILIFFKEKRLVFLVLLEIGKRIENFFENNIYNIKEDLVNINSI